MILHELKRYLVTHGTVTQTELARHFYLSEDGIDAMLSVDEKGEVSRLVDTQGNTCVQRVRYRINQPQTISLTAIM
ncbi:FeoC-like transcriptional regulator [Vibrio sp. PP-XX7]